MKDPTIRRVLVFFLFIAAILIGVAVEAVRNISRSMAASDWVNHTHSVILETERVRSALHVGTGALHTYALTGDARDLAAAREALADLNDQLETAKALTREEPAQNDQLQRIDSLVNRRVEFVQGVLAAREANNMDLVRTRLAEDAGGAAVREILQKLDKLKNDELALLSDRDTASYLQGQTTRWTVWAGVVLDVLLLGGVGWLIRDDLAARRQAAAVLQEANTQLEARVKERTAELAATNTRLSTENLERRWTNQALEHQLRYNQLVVDSINDLVLILTKALNISRMNPAVAHATGFEPTELINQPLARLVHPPPPRPGEEAPLRDPIAQALQDGRDLREHATLVEDRRGRMMPARLSLFPLRDQDKVVGGVVILQLLPPAAEARSPSS